MMLLASCFAAAAALAAPADPSAVKAVAALDTQYQAAVKAHDVRTMDRILADDFVLVTGRGRAQTKADLLAEARDTTEVFEHQEDTNQTVRVWGDTAVVTALLWEKGTNKGAPFDYHLWFSDTYVRTPGGWRYVFGQASLPLPASPPPSGEDRAGSPSTACAGAPFRQFDFFAGDRNAYDAAAPSTVVARNIVSIVLDGCAVLEDYRQNDGVHGREGSAVRETADRSRDGGHTWTPAFDLLFRPHEPHTGS